MRYLEKLTADEITALANDVANFILREFYDTVDIEDTRSMEIQEEIKNDYLEYIEFNEEGAHEADQ